MDLVILQKTRSAEGGVFDSGGSRGLRRPGLSDSYFSKVQFWTASWSLLSFFGGRSPAKIWQSIRGTVRKLQKAKVAFRNPGHRNARGSFRRFHLMVLMISQQSWNLQCFERVLQWFPVLFFV